MAAVIVVGAGPAGAAAATLLARRGIETLLLERQVFPRDKPCGDCLSPGANAVLKRLGVWRQVEALRPARLLGWRLRAPAGATFTGRFRGAGRDPAVGLALRRRELDAVLMEAARAAGATVHTGVRVLDLLRENGAVAGVLADTGTGAPVEIRAPLTIGADGLRSVVVRRLGLVRRRPRSNKISLTAHVQGMPGPGGWGEIHVGHGIVAGLAPVTAADGPDRVSNLTVVVGSARMRGPGRAAPREAIVRLASELDGLRDRLGAVRPMGPILASGQFDCPVRRLVVRGAALVGDAAGYYDPLTGQGIFQALAGAEILAEEAAAALCRRAGTAIRLTGYERRHRGLTRPVRRLQWLIEQVIARPGLADTSFGRLAAAPDAAETLIAVTGDLRPVRALLSPSLWYSFSFGGTDNIRETS